MNYIGQIQRIEFENQVYWLSRFERRIIRQWMRWSKPQLRNPLDIAAQALSLEMDPSVKNMIVIEADKYAHESLDFLSDEMQAIFMSEEGQQEVVILLLLDANKTLLRQKAEEIAKVLDTDDIIRIASGTPYIAPGDVGVMVDDDRRRMPINWYEIDHSLIENFYYKPQDLDNLTLTELFSLYRKIEDDVGEKMAFEHARAYHKLSPEQKLSFAYQELQD